MAGPLMKERRSRWRGRRPPRRGRPPHVGEEKVVERASRQTSSARQVVAGPLMRTKEKKPGTGGTG